MTTKTKTSLALSALVAALALGAAPAAFADPDGRRGDYRADRPAPLSAPSPAWRDDRAGPPAPPTANGPGWRDTDNRRDDWRDARADYRNPNAFVNVSFRERIDRIEGWISRSVERGALSRRDAHWLWRQLDDTRALAISYRRSHGSYTVWEADEIDARLGRIRNQIRDQKRDDQWSGWRNDDWRGRSTYGF